MAMEKLKRITLLVLPPDCLPSWRVSLSLRGAAAAFGVWTLLTLWAGASAMRRADYWATKAENVLMQQRLEAVLDEMERSRDDLEKGREADRKLRELLGMPSKRAILEADRAASGGSRTSLTPSEDPLASGGPLPQDRVTLARGLAQQRAESFQEIMGFLARARRQFWDTPMGRPAEGRLSSTYGYRVSPVRGGEDDAEFHGGLDIANAQGTPIRATADGVVQRAGWAGGYGKMVLVRNEHGFSTLYGHASRLAVTAGQRVRRGDIVAYMGTTGRSTGNHVHYEVWRGGRPVNPAPYLQEAR